jgi:glutathione S-transferase
MKLHWSPKSPYVRKVMVVAHEAGLLDRLTLVRSVPLMLQPNEELMRDNPLSKIPTLVLDDGTTLMDSAVICEYLDDLAGASLFPRTGAPRWQALRWHALGDGLLDALILWRNERERAAEAQLPVLIQAFEHKTRATLALLDEEEAALTAAPFGIGQIAVACALGYLDFRFDALGWRDIAPRLAQWHEVVMTRPSLQATLPPAAG